MTRTPPPTREPFLFFNFLPTTPASNLQGLWEETTVEASGNASKVLPHQFYKHPMVWRGKFPATFGPREGPNFSGCETVVNSRYSSYSTSSQSMAFLCSAGSLVGLAVTSGVLERKPLRQSVQSSGH